MLLEYWNAHGAQVASQRADATAIQKQLYSRKARGIHASDMESLSQGVGLSRVSSQRRLEGPSEQLKQGRPLIASIQQVASEPRSTTW